MFLNVCKQTFHISHVRIPQKVKGFNVKYYFQMKTKMLIYFQICIGVPLMTLAKLCLRGVKLSKGYRKNGESGAQGNA